MSIKYRNKLPGLWPHDDFGWPWTWDELPAVSWTWKGQWVDTDKYEIVPKASYKKELIEAKQKELDTNEENRKRLEEELNKLKNS